MTTKSSTGRGVLLATVACFGLSGGAACGFPAQKAVAQGEGFLQRLWKAVEREKGIPSVQSMAAHEAERAAKYSRDVQRHATEVGGSRIESHSNQFNHVPGGPWKPLQNEKIAAKALGSEVAYRLPKHVEEPAVLALVPTTDNAFKHVFGKQMTTASSRVMATNQTAFKALPRSHCMSDDTFGIKRLEEFFQNLDGKTNTVVLVGHSEGHKGERVLRLLNGESITVAEVQKAAQKADKQCLVLTCFGNDFSIPGEIAIDDAYTMVERGLGKVGKFHEAKQTMTTDDFARIIRNELTIIKTRRVVISATVAGAGGLGALTVVCEYEEDKSPEVKRAEEDQKRPNATKRP